ncbi:MAG: hypothetical protein LWY06_11310 [Firmicutes bacterium]|nr:hypothetical protein [Bacillota bacterium]
MPPKDSPENNNKQIREVNNTITEKENSFGKTVVRLLNNRKLWINATPVVIIAMLFFSWFRAMELFTIPWPFMLLIDIAVITATLRLAGYINNAWAISLGTMAALLPQYYIRSKYEIYMFLCDKYGTYPGDIWYCWNNYLEKGFAYPVEYPSGIQMLFKFIFKFKPQSLNYEGYTLGMSVFLGIFALISTLITYHIISTTHKKTWRIWVFWILAPTFLFYGLYNLDFLSVFTVIMAYYLFTEEEYYLSASVIAIGGALKVFPFFIAPLLFFQCPKKKRIPFTLTVILVWLAFNVPFMISDWGAWKFPYQWQITNNYAKSTDDGCVFWVVNNILLIIQNWAEVHLRSNSFLFGIHTKLTPYAHHMGKISLILYASLYFIFLRKKWNLPLAHRMAGIMILFLLTDRIYSPQYNLYLLPFLALADFSFRNKKEKIGFYVAFYIAEIINIVHVIFLFKLRHIYSNLLELFPFKFIYSAIPNLTALIPAKFPLIFQGMIAVKYLCLIYLLRAIWITPPNPDYENWKDGSGKNEEVKEKPDEVKSDEIKPDEDLKPQENPA